MENKQPQITFNITGGTQNNVGSQVNEQHNTFSGNDMKTQNLKTGINNCTHSPASCLNTPEAQALWQKLQDAGWVDENRQPTKKLRTKVAKSVLANIMANKLEIPNPMYEPFESLWGEKDLLASYAAGNSNGKNNTLKDEIRKSLK